MSIQEMTERLDKLYWTDPQGYLDFLQRVKSIGNKVYRNSKGQHRVECAFGDILSQIFNGDFK